MITKLNVIDLFAGCGGLADGFEQSKKYKTLACVEWEKEPCKTLELRLRDKWKVESSNELVLRFDIQRTGELINGWHSDSTYGDGAGLKEIVGNKKVDVVVGGPPCQAYSVAGRIRDKNGMHDDYRNYLFESYLKIVDHYQPKVFVFENVPGMLSAKPGGISIVERVTQAFSESGYEIISDLQKYALIDCTKYSIPQSRKRIIILGVKKTVTNTDIQTALLDFYENLLPAYKGPAKTVYDAIGSLPPLMPLKEPVVQYGRKVSHRSEKSEAFYNHQPRMHSLRDIATFQLLANDIRSGTFKFIKAEALKELYFEKTGKRSNVHKYHVLRWDRPSNTIPAHLYKDGLRHIHPDPDQARTITVREAAKLQTFDDDYLFTGSITDQYKMIGNAVPPKFAKVVALAVNDFIKKYF
jgi:DNA (cytosine-5)-methyltransferase 1